jgi:DNA adenine methylase
MSDVPSHKVHPFLRRAGEKRLLVPRGAELAGYDFETTIENVKPGDLVLLDAPYTVAHNHNGFRRYNQKLFAFDDQMRLLRTAKEIDDIGAYYPLTNAAHASIIELFRPAGGCIELTRRSAISAKASSRGTARELLFTNIPES